MDIGGTCKDVVGIERHFGDGRYSGDGVGDSYRDRAGDRACEHGNERWEFCTPRSGITCSSSIHLGTLGLFDVSRNWF